MQWLPWGDCIGKSVHFCQNLEYVNNINSVNKKSIKAKFWTYAKKGLSKKSVTWLLDLIYVCRFVMLNVVVSTGHVCHISDATRKRISSLGSLHTLFTDISHFVRKHTPSIGKKVILEAKNVSGKK
jgi:hypothetical protein